MGDNLPKDGISHEYRDQWNKLANTMRLIKLGMEHFDTSSGDGHKRCGLLQVQKAHDWSEL